jgi:segregation and condensation protein A
MSAEPLADEVSAPAVDDTPRLKAARATGVPALALVRGEAVLELPTDLYIPPEALEVFLETFEGPLDLLLYLIRRENLDILEIRVAEITEQYMTYIEIMHSMQLELAGEYLLMAAMLAEIKSRMLLPRPAGNIDDEDDPRAELIRRLQEYEQLKNAAEQLNALPRMERDLFPAHALRPQVVRQRNEPEVDLRELLVALAEVLQRAERFRHHQVRLEPLNVRERMTRVRDAPDFVPFGALFAPEEGRRGVVVTFLAILELLRERLIDFVQHAAFAPIYVRAGGR